MTGSSHQLFRVRFVTPSPAARSSKDVAAKNGEPLAPRPVQAFVGESGWFIDCFPPVLDYPVVASLSGD